MKKQLQNKSEWRDGYDYACGALIRFEETPNTITKKITEPITAFDKGIKDAIHRLIYLKVINDDRD